MRTLRQVQAKIKINRRERTERKEPGERKDSCLQSTRLNADEEFFLAISASSCGLTTESRPCAGHPTLFRAQGDGEELGNVVDEMGLHFLAHFHRHFQPVIAVLLGQDDLF